MAMPRKGRAKRHRGCGLCKPHRRQGNGKERRPVKDRRALQDVRC